MSQALRNMVCSYPAWEKLYIYIASELYGINKDLYCEILILWTGLYRYLDMFQWLALLC